MINFRGIPNTAKRIRNSLDDVLAKLKSSVGYCLSVRLARAFCPHSATSHSPFAAFPPHVSVAV